MDLVGYWTWHTANCDCHSIKLTLQTRDESKLKDKTNQTKTKAEFKTSSRATINRKINN